MADPMPPLAAEVEALREAYAALNRNDIPGFVSLFAPEVVFLEPEDFPMAGTYRGLAEVTAHVKRARSTWAEGSCEPEQFIVAGDKVVALVQVHVRLRDETDWREGALADVYTFRDGKAVEMRVFADRRQGLEWAGVPVSESN